MGHPENKGTSLPPPRQVSVDECPWNDCGPTGDGRLRKPRQVPAEQDEPDPGAGVEEKMRDHERPRPAPTQEQRAEEQPHGEVPSESTPPLIQVVRAAQQRARGDCGDGREAELPEPRYEV